MIINRSSERGFSLVSVMIILGVVMTAILMISQAKVNQQKVQRALKAKGSYTDINQALINDIVSQLHTSMGASCPNVGTIYGNRSVDGKMNYSERNRPSYGTVGVPPAHQNALNRCQRNTPRVTGNNRFHFCAQLTRASGVEAPKDSILGAKNAFAEVVVELIDLQTQQAINCNEYKTRVNDPRDGSAGMAVTMALYWETNGGANSSNYSWKGFNYIANLNE